MYQNTAHFIPEDWNFLAKYKRIFKKCLKTCRKSWKQNC